MKTLASRFTWNRLKSLYLIKFQKKKSFSAWSVRVAQTFQILKFVIDGNLVLFIFHSKSVDTVFRCQPIRLGLCTKQRGDRVLANISHVIHQVGVVLEPSFLHTFHAQTWWIPISWRRKSKNQRNVIKSMNKTAFLFLKKAQ